MRIGLTYQGALRRRRRYILAKLLRAWAVGAAVVTTALAAPPPAGAQSGGVAADSARPPVVIEDGQANSLSVGFSEYLRFSGDWRPLAVTLQSTGVRRAGGMAADYAFTFFPGVYEDDVGLYMADIGMAYSAPLPGAALLFRFGGSVISLTGDNVPDDEQLVPGVYVGTGAIIAFGSRFGLRLDLLSRSRLEEPISPVSELRFGITSLPGAQRR